VYVLLRLYQPIVNLLLRWRFLKRRNLCHTNMQRDTGVATMPTFQLHVARVLLAFASLGPIWTKGFRVCTLIHQSVHRTIRKANVVIEVRGGRHALSALCRGERLWSCFYTDQECK
jgi:hypothetical protein